jgi:alpha-tubulin suppressor-like RCC1 family protein
VEGLKKIVVTSIAAGEMHSLCCTIDGDLYAWGSNQHGQLGLRAGEVSTNSSGIVCSVVPKRVSFLEKSIGKAVVSNAFNYHKSRILQIAASYDGSMVLCGPTMNDNYCNVNTESILAAELCNHVYQWGYGIPLPTKVHFWNRSSSRRTRSLSCDEFIHVGGAVLVNITQITTGKHHNAALSSDGKVYMWGLGSDHLGQSNENPTSSIKHHVPLSNPQVVEALLPECGGGRIVNISASLNRTCAVSDVGDLYTWGSTFDKVKKNAQ